MNEAQHVRQVPGDGLRRWFYDDDFDLFVWYNPNGSIHGFQLSYDKTGDEKSLTWFRNRGISHHAVDGGEQNPGRNRSPILIAEDGRAAMPRILDAFNRTSTAALPSKVRALVLRKIMEYGEMHLPVAQHWKAALVITAFASALVISKLASDKFLYGKR